MGGNGATASMSKYDIKANIAIATADASSTAKVEKGGLVNDGRDMNVRSAGQSNAKATVGSGTELAVAGIGLNLLYVKANGIFDAAVRHATGLKVSNLNVNTEYSATATALGAVSKQGTASAKLVDVKVNLAEAIVGTKAYASVADLTLDSLKNSLNANVKGNSVTAKSNIGSAKLDASGIKVAANISTAKAQAAQTAEINGLTIKGAGNSGSAINANSTLNAEAESKVGTTGGTSVSLLSVEGSKATADSNATARAKVVNLDMDRKNYDVNVKAALTKDKAYADVVNGLKVSLLNVGVINTDANARGKVEAQLSADKVNFRARNLNVTANYDADADALVKATGNTIGGFNGKFHTATTNTQVNALAKLANNGGYLALEGDLKVAATGKVASDASAETPTWTIGVGNVAANRSTANANVSQTAALDNRNGGIEAKGDVSVTSEITNSNAKATVGSPANRSKSLGLLDGASNIARANEKVSSAVEVTGAKSILSAGKAMTLKSNAKNATGATAVSKAASSNGLMTLGNLEVYAYTADSFTVKLEGLELRTGTGDLVAQAYANTRAYGEGVAPGGYTAVNGSSSKVNSGVGESSGSRQTAQVLVGKNTLLNSGKQLQLKAENYGSVESKMLSKGSYSLGSVQKSSVPTASFYRTKIDIGDGSVLNSKNNMWLYAKDKAGARSDVDADGMGLVMSLNEMQGKNELTQENLIKLGNNVALGSTAGKIDVWAYSDADMYARSRFMGKFGIVGGNDVTATNTLTRSATVQVGDYAKMTAGGGLLKLYAQTGSEDSIVTRAEVQGSGVLSRGNSYARTYITDDTTVKVGKGGNLFSKNDLQVWAEAKLNKVDTQATSETKGLGVNPHAEAYSEIRNKAYVKLNENAGDMLYLTSANNGVSVRATGWTLNVYNRADARGEAAGGGSYALADIWVDILHHVYLDKTQLDAKNGEVLVHAINSEGGTSRLEADAYAKMYAAGGYVEPIARLRGSIVNEIRSRRTGGGYEDYLIGKSIRHYAQMGNQNISLNPHTDYSRIYVPVYYPSGGYWKHVWAFIYVWVPTFSKVEVSTTIDYSSSQNSLGYGSARDDLAKGSFNRRQATAAQVDIGALTKALQDTIGSGAASTALKGVWKAKFDEEMNRLAGELFVLDVKALLQKDARLEGDGLKRYYLWNNTYTLLDTYMLPNATRLNVRGNGTLRYVTEVLEGDVLSDGVSRKLQMVTALTKDAFNKPLVEVNRTTTLDFSNGTLRVESGDDFELYLDELSGAWLLDQLQSGDFQVIDVDSDAIENYNEGDRLPSGDILSGVTEDGEDGRGSKVYWIGGRTPDNVQDGDTPMYALLVNEETDEVDAFCATLNGMDAIDLSLLIYRDSKSDRRGEIRYNVMFYASEDPEKSKVEVITDVLEGRELYTPSKLNVVLRQVKVSGADGNAYSILNNVFALDDGTDGVVNVVNGAYTATFDGDVFESDYTRIEGCASGDLKVTVKQDQPIWPEWDDKTSAHDIGDRKYRLDDEGWTDVTDEDKAPADDSAVNV